MAFLIIINENIPNKQYQMKKNSKNFSGRNNITRLFIRRKASKHKADKITKT